MKTLFLQIFCLMLVCSSCNNAGNIFGGNIVVRMNEKKPYIESVKVQNDQIIVKGRNLESITLAKVEGSATHQFQIESKTSEQLILNAKSALAVLVGGALNLIISNSQASATFPLSFELQNGQVKAQHLHHMGASTGDFLQWNGASWAPTSISTSQVYVGTYDAATDTPDIVGAGGSSGTYYIVTVAGTQDLGAGPMNYDVGDWIIYNGVSWSKISVGTNTVSNFNGRTGAVVPLSGDYSWSMLTKAAGKLTGSKLQEIADVDIAGIQDGDILIWNSTSSKWESGAQPSLSIPAGSISNTQLATSAVDSSKIVDGSIMNADISAAAAIDQSKINGLTGALNGKEPNITAGNAAQYWSGTKSWQNLNPAVLGSILTGYSASTGAITAADTILSAMGKLSGNIGVTAAAQANYVLKAGDTMSGPLAMGGNKITGLGTPTAASDAATKDYVDTKVGTASQWTTSGSNILYNTGSVGIGTTTPEGFLHVASPNYAPAVVERTSTTHTNSRRAALIALASTTLDMVDGFGSHIDFSVKDSAAVNNMLGSVGAMRSGADNSGSLYFMTNHLGSAQIHMKIDNLGNTGFGNLVPTEKLDVAGNIALTGKVRFKSDTVNYVELQAPAGLAGNLNFRLPATAGTSGQALTTDGSGNLSWATVSSGAIADGSVGYAKLNLVDGDVPLAKLAGASDATKYLKGNKTWGTFLTDVLASTFATVTPSDTVIANGDTLSVVVNKTQGQINQLKTDSATYLIKNATDAITGTVTVDAATGALKIPTTPSGVDLTDATNVQYVQNYVGTFGQWNKNGTALHTNNYVGIGHDNPSTFFHAVGTGGGNDDLMIDSINDVSESAIMLRRARGTAALPTPPLTNDRLGFLGFRALTVAPSTYNEMARVQGVAETDIGTTQSGQLQFWTRNNGTYLEKMRINAAGNVGIGTTTPDKKLVVTDPTPIADGTRSPVAEFNAMSSVGAQKRGIVLYGAGTGGSVAVGKNTNAPLHFLSLAGTELMTVMDSGNIGIGVTAPAYPLQVESTNTDTASATQIAQNVNVFNLDPTAASSANYYTHYNVTKPTGLQNLTGYVQGDRVIVDNSNTGTISNTYGQYTEIKNGSTGTMTVAYSNRSNVSNFSTGSIGTARAGSFAVNNFSTGTITNAYGLHVDPLSNSSGTVSNYYGLYIGSTAAATTNKYGVYAVDGLNYFGGAVGVGTQPSLAQMHVRGGGNLLALQADATGDHGYLSFYIDSENPTVRSGFIGYPSVGSNTLVITNQQSADVLIGVSSLKNNLTVNGTATTCTIGNGTAATSCTSDARLKDNVRIIPDALQKFLRLEGVYFDWNEKANSPGKPGMGVIAQKIEKEFPLAVTTNEKTGYKQVDYASLISPLIEAFKSFYQEFQGQKRSIASYEKKQVELENRVKNLEQQNKQLLNILCRKDPAACKNP